MTHARPDLHHTASDSSDVSFDSAASDSNDDDPVTLTSLPPELLLQIIDYASPPGCTTTSEALRRYAYLRDTSLVCKAFSRPSQALLYSSIMIQRPTMASRWLASPLLGMYAIRELDLVGVHSGAGLSGTTAARIMSKAVGVQWLRLQDFKRLSCRCLASDNLRYLDTLILQTPFPDKAPVIESLRIPFRLSTLHVYNRSYDPLLLDRLLKASRGTLRSLHLSLSTKANAYPGLVAGFPDVAPSLQRLVLHHKPSPEFVALLAACSSLRHLRCHPDVDVALLLATLPSDARVSSLEVSVDYTTNETCRVLNQYLFGGVGVGASRPSEVLSELRLLRLRGVTEYEMYMMGQRSFIEGVQNRGIRLVLEEGDLKRNWAVQTWTPGDVT